MNIAEKINDVFLLFLVICVSLLVLITVLMITFVIKYNKNRNKEKPQNIKGSAWLEITWTIIPTLLVLGMFYYGWVNYSIEKDIPKDAMEIAVTGRQWSWLFNYPNGAQTDTLYVPVGKDVKLDLTSQDVIHSFFIPAYRIKQDVVPGMTNHLWFHVIEEGTYDVLCAEYCGLQHSYMLTSLVAMPPEKFQAWYSSQAKQVAAETTATSAGEESETALAKKGEILYTQKGCISCHSRDGSPSVGPTLMGLFGHEVTVVTNGKERTLTVNEEYVQRSLLHPDADIAKGFQNLMPPQDMTDEEIKAIIAFLQQLHK